jgi:YbbR domain-containing protein
VISLFVPIEVKNAPVEKALIKPMKRGVQITLKGPSFLIGPVASSPPPMRVKIPDTDADRVSVSFKPSDISLPSSVEVLSIEPAQMEFVFEPLDRQDLRVEVPKVGELAQGLILEGIEITPKFVAVRGARSDLIKLKSIEAEPVNLSSVNESTELTLGLRVVGASVTPSTRTVQAKVSVVQQPSEKTFSARPVELRISNGVGSLEVKPEKVSVVVLGSPSVLSRLDEEKVVPFIRVPQEIGKVAASKTVEVELPAGVTLRAVEPATVSVVHADKEFIRTVGKRK